MKLYLMLFSVIILSACKSSDPHFTRTGLNDTFDFPGGTFQDYIQHERQKIKAARTKAFGKAPSDKTVTENAPNEIRPSHYLPGQTKKYKHAAIVLHGLIVTPFKMKEISQFLASQGMLVRNVLLPGHGTVVGDLTKVKKEEWVKAAEFAIEDTQTEAENIHLVGYSTGAGIAIAQALKRNDIASLMVFSPLVEINSSISFAAITVAKATSLVPSASYPIKASEINPYQYYSISYNAVGQAHRVTNDIKKFAGKTNKKIPIFMATPLQDSIVRADKSIEFFKRYADSSSHLMLFSKNDYKTKDPRIQVVPSAVPGKKILSLSHEGILSHINNPVYGINGFVRDCLLYKPGSEMRKKCETMDLKDLYFGEQAAIKKRKDMVISRINFNPFFDQMTEELKQFILKLQK